VCGAREAKGGNSLQLHRQGCVTHCTLLSCVLAATHCCVCFVCVLVWGRGCWCLLLHTKGVQGACGCVAGRACHEKWSVRVLTLRPNKGREAQSNHSAPEG
jgi:hypothetical protein